MKRSLLISIVLLYNVCSAQFPDYYVYLVKGNVTVSNQKGKHTLKQGEFLYKTDALIFADRSELTLTNKDADYFVLNASNNVKLNSLQAKNARSYAGITKKYLNLVWDEVLDPNYDFTKFKSKNLTGVYGGVSRSDECKNLVFPVNGLKTSSADINFKWLKTSASNNYNFFLYDGAGNKIFNKPVQDTLAVFNVEQLQLRPGKYYWLIKSNDAICEDEVPLYFEILTRADEDTLVESLMPGQPPENVNDELEIIERLEKNALIYAAKERFGNALAKFPGNEALNKMYVMFLLNYGFDDEAAQVWLTVKKS
ncbi:MAG: hypothetical protein JO072_05845 [Parafilimonas sp.]|nr:hypothetical protein [Parafilimonas sp.]